MQLDLVEVVVVVAAVEVVEWAVEDEAVAEEAAVAEIEVDAVAEEVDCVKPNKLSLTQITNTETFL